jgi:hypothetical protein
LAASRIQLLKKIVRISDFYAGLTSVECDTIFFEFNPTDRLCIPFGRSVVVWLTVELFAALYIVSFIWLWLSCRSAARTQMIHRQPEQRSNLIPFERGLELNIPKSPRTF